MILSPYCGQTAQTHDETQVKCFYGVQKLQMNAGIVFCRLLHTQQHNRGVFLCCFFFFYKSVCFQSKSTVTVTHFLIHLTDPPCVTTDRRLSTHTNIMQCVVQAVITTKKVGSDRSDSGADPCGAADSSNSSMKVLCSAGDGLLSAKRLFWQSGSLCCRALCFRLGR